MASSPPDTGTGHPSMDVASGDLSRRAVMAPSSKRTPPSASQRDGAEELRKQPARSMERRRHPHIQAVVEEQDEDEHAGSLRFRESSAPKTGEVWTIYFQCKGKDPENEFVDVHLDKADVTYFNLASFKEQLGYGPRDFMYYKMRCGRDVAKLEAMGYIRDADTVLRMNEAEREIRLVLSKEQEHEVDVAITPIKRPREKGNNDDSSTLEDIDAYKLWLTKLQSKDPDTDLRDAFRDETIETYKEWLRHTGRRQHMLSLLEENTNDDDITEGEENDRPSHARKPKNLGDGEKSKTRGRGCLKGLTVTNKRIRNRTQKLKIEFNPRLGGPIGENRRSFVDEVVTFTRKKSPLIGVKTWKGVHPKVKMSIADDILLNWDLQNVEEPKEKIWAIAKERYKGWRAAFSATYRAYRTDAERMKHKPEDLDNVEWYYLIQYFGSESFQKKSTKNTENRKKQKTQHLMGSKPFSQVSYDQRDPTTGKEPADLDLWMVTHTKGGQWSNPDTLEVYENALVKIAEAELSKDKQCLTVEEENALFQKYYKETIGTKTYRCHGHGYMAKYPTRTALLNEREENLARSSAAALQHREEVEDLKQKLANEVVARERDKEESIRQMQELREELRLQVALLQANPGNTTCSQPPNSATVGMNDITPPRIEDEAQEIQPASVMTTVKEVDPPTRTTATANTTVTRNLFPTDNNDQPADSNSSQQQIRPAAKTRNQKKKLQEIMVSQNN